MSPKNEIPFIFPKGNRYIAFKLKVSKTRNASNFNKGCFPLLTNNKIPLKFLIHCFISLNLLKGEEGIIHERDEGTSSTASSPNSNPSTSHKGGPYIPYKKIQSESESETDSETSAVMDIKKSRKKRKYKSRKNKGGPYKKTRTSTASTSPRRGYKKIQSESDSSEAEATQAKEATFSKKSSSSPRLPMGLQDNGHYNFPKTLKKDNLIIKKIYQLIGLDCPSLKIKFNQRFLNINILNKYLYEYTTSKAVSNLQNNYPSSFILKIIYIRLLTNLWNFLIVNQEKKYQEFIQKYLINEIGKLRKTLTKNWYMIIFIETTPTYDLDLFKLFINKVTETDNDIMKHDVKFIGSEDAVELHYILLKTFHQLFVDRNISIKIQNYALYLHKFEQNNHLFRNLIRNMNDKNIWHNFKNLNINLENCQITKNTVTFDDNTNDPIITFKCKKLKRN
ncbi:hypothetical protein TCON_2583 [Astathelohania contejeani]|uniref:Uncharacterized protein n=1 Tax=Astathelohania contejeani TaxID=164912 RepID=A0ABQ7HVL3_9MICR|nr:hypothetical protein TCON_2583 [Thelohania contejeani]